MQSKPAEEGKVRVNYQDKNLEFLERLKDKKARELQERALVERKQQQRRDNLKRKILEQASLYRQNKLREISDIGNTPGEGSRGQGGARVDSLPKIQKEKLEDESGDQKADYQQRYISFLQNLHQNIKSKKEVEEGEKRKKEERLNKFKEGLSFENVESKLGFFRTSKAASVAKQISQDNNMLKTHSAEKFASLMEIAEAEMPRTNKNFKRKNEEYLRKIKEKRDQEVVSKEEEKRKKEKLKEKLKDYVMHTVKKNVIQGLYDDELDKKQIKASRKDLEGEDEEGEEESSEEEQGKKKARKMRAFPYVTDLAQWRKKNRLQNGEKVFIITGGYADLKRALRERGWVQNPDVHSCCFNLKFTLQGREIDYGSLLDFQLANHFQKNGVITTKAGLTRSLRNLMWINDTSADTFYPKCFDLNDEDDFVAFEVEFKICKALSILKIYADYSKSKMNCTKENKVLLQDLKLRAEVALLVCSKNIQDLNEIIDVKKLPKVITDKQWEILASDELNEEGLAKKKHEQWLKSIDSKFAPTFKDGKAKQKPKKKKSAEGSAEKQQQGDELLQKVQEVLAEYERRDCQYDLTGHNNIWILKPAGLSRGRGIICYNNYVQIQDHIKCKESLWIAQKYIQNPLVVLKRKFDIRQWVLITDFNPLTIWLYEECYIRFSAIDYDPKQVSNKFIHLTNNSIGAYYKEFDKSPIKGNMFFQTEFSDYLREKEGYDVFAEKIKPQFNDIIKQSMMCALDGIENRKNTHELFGYDFMVDEDYKVWLIEVNSSPAMDYSTHVTARLVKEVMHDLAKVIVDYKAAPKRERKHVNTGKFKRIYKGMDVPDKIPTTGLNLCLEGVPLKKPKKNAIRIQTFSLGSPQPKQVTQEKESANEKEHANEKESEGTENL